MARSAEQWQAIVDLGERLARGAVAIDNVEFPEWFEEQDVRDLLTMTRYWRDYIAAKKRQGNRRGHALLRSLLDDDQRDQLRRTRAFRVTTDSGATYRLIPATGVVHAVERHGKHWYMTARFCYHPDRADRGDDIPNVDVTIGHMLLLMCDEDQFLSEANATPSWPMEQYGVANAGWAALWRRRLREAQLQRAREEHDASVRAELQAEGVDPDEFLAELQAEAAVA